MRLTKSLARLTSRFGRKKGVIDLRPYDQIDDAERARRIAALNNADMPHGESICWGGVLARTPDRAYLIPSYRTTYGSYGWLAYAAGLPPTTKSTVVIDLDAWSTQATSRGYDVEELLPWMST